MLVAPGLDVHKKTVNVCIRPGKGNKLQIFTALFGTLTVRGCALPVGCAFDVHFDPGHTVHRTGNEQEFVIPPGESIVGRRPGPVGILRMLFPLGSKAITPCPLLI